MTNTQAPPRPTGTGPDEEGAQPVAADQPATGRAVPVTTSGREPRDSASRERASARAAPPSAPGEGPFAPLQAAVLRFGVGKLAVIVVGLLLVAAQLVHIRVATPWSGIVRDVLLTGFVGGFTNTIAIRMLFDKVWYLPGSGVLLAKREAIILSLADTMEAHILNPDLLAAWFDDLDVSAFQGRFVGGANAVLDEMRDDLIAGVDNPARRAQVRTAIAEQGGFWGRMANAVGIVSYDDVAAKLLRRISGEIRTFRIEEGMVATAFDKLGSLEAFLLEPNNPLVVRHYGRHESVAQLVFEELDVKRLVVERLSAYDASQIRDILSDNIREHLAWLEVFGVLLGVAFGALAQLVDALL